MATYTHPLGLSIDPISKKISGGGVLGCDNHIAMVLDGVGLASVNHYDIIMTS